MFRITLLISIFFILQCKTPEKYYHRPLIKQRLVVRPGYPGKLTNRVCNGDNCTTEEYSLSDPAFRQTANDLRIICEIAGKRWRICLARPGYCRRTLKCVKKFLWSCKKYEELYIPAERHDYLISANTVCQGKD